MKCCFTPIKIKNLSNAGKGCYGLERIGTDIVKRNHVVNGFYSITVMTSCMISRTKNTFPMCTA